MSIVWTLCSLDLRCHCHKCLLYICCVLGTCFQEWNLELVCKLLQRVQKVNMCVSVCVLVCVCLRWYTLHVKQWSPQLCPHDKRLTPMCVEQHVYRQPDSQCTTIHVPQLPPSPHRLGLTFAVVKSTTFLFVRSHLFPTSNLLTFVLAYRSISCSHVFTLANDSYRRETRREGWRKGSRRESGRCVRGRRGWH